MADTIFALSSGSPPAGIAIVRISGPKAGAALCSMFGRMPEPRRATAGPIVDRMSGELLDHGLVLWFPGPSTATGEDLAELHLHGGRSVVAGVLAALQQLDGYRAAEAGEFTKRAFLNGRIDLSEAEGLGDLLAAETQSQRRAALLMASGSISRRVGEWRRRVLQLAAGVEAVLDFSDEEDVAEQLPTSWYKEIQNLAEDLEFALDRPRSERLKDGVRVAIGGPPNAGKSTLFNSLVQREAAITSSTPGTTRDIIEVPVAIDGVPFLFIDTAGLRETADDIESIGVDRARLALDLADIVLWLGASSECPEGRVIQVAAKADLPDQKAGGLQVSALTGYGIGELLNLLVASAKDLLPAEGEVALNARHVSLLGTALKSLRHAREADDLLVKAEELRRARIEFDRVTGQAGVEDMLDALFGNFCIGK